MVENRASLRRSRARVWTLLAPVVATALLLSGCTGGHGPSTPSHAVHTGGGGSGPVVQLQAATRPTGAQLRYGTTIGHIPGVTYQPDVVVLGGGASSIRSADGSGYVWTIDGSAPGASRLHVGSVLVATTMASGRVLAITDVAGGDRQVVLGPLALTDVIKDGTFRTTTPIAVANPLAYSFPTDPTARQIPDTDGQAGPHSARERSLTGHGPVVGKPPAPPRPTLPHDLPSDLPSNIPSNVPSNLPSNIPSNLPTNIPSDASGSKNVKLPLPSANPSPITEGDVTLTPTCCNPMQVAIAYHGVNGRMDGNLGIEVGAPSLTASVTIGGSHLIDASVRLNQAAAVFFNFEAATKNVDGNKPRTVFRLPVSFTIPATPLSIAVSFNLSMSIQLAGQAALSSHAKYALDGPLGVEFTGGHLKTLVPKVKVVTSVSNSAFSAGVSVNAISLAFNASLSVGFGVPGLHVGPFVGITASLAFDKDGSPPQTSLTLGCSDAKVRITGVVGVGYTVSETVVKVVNFFLKIVGAAPIKSSAGPKWPFVIWDPPLSKECLKRH